MAYDGADITYFYDGVLASTSTVALSTASSAVTVGQRTSADFGDSFDGFVDDVRLYDRVITDEEIRTVYSDSPVQVRLVAKTNGIALWLKADKGLSTNVDGANVASWLDSSGNGNSVVQTVDTDRPSLILDDANGYPSLDFEADIDELADANGILGSGRCQRSNILHCSGLRQ